MVKTETIRFYDYDGKIERVDGVCIIPIERHYDGADYYEEKCFVVGGVWGIFGTVSIREDLFAVLRGDDGHWWVDSIISKHWAADISECFSKIGESNG